MIHLSYYTQIIKKEYFFGTLMTRRSENK
jgi:hypothetical protein